MEVYAKYVVTNNAKLDGFIKYLTHAKANGTAPSGTMADGGSYPASTSSFQNRIFGIFMKV